MCDVLSSEIPFSLHFPLQKSHDPLVIGPMIMDRTYLGLFALFCLWLTALPAFAGDEVAAAQNQGPTLIHAVMCEYIQEYVPQNTAVVFSIETGKISCFTSFDGVKKSTYTMHKWYRRDKLVTTKRLTLKPPSWSTYSSIQLREADKGPWRVDIWNAHNQLLQTLRFSVTD